VAAIYLDQLLPVGSRDLPAVIARAKQQLTWSCRRWGLPCQGRHRSCGALLPHHFTIACTTFAVIGCVFSVALSRGFPRVAVSHHRALSCSDFPPPAASLLRSKTAGATARPTLFNWLSI